jgi:hypothetical protein
MRPRHTSVADTTPVRVVLLTLDSHMASAVERAQHALLKELPGLRLSLHAAAEWDDDPAALARCHADIAQGDIVVISMMFMEDHIRAVLPALQARRDHCDAMVACMSAAEVVRLTRLGRFSMNGEASGPLALLKRLRGDRSKSASSGQQQMRMLRRIPKILRFIPGPAQDVRAYFLTMQYLFAGSDDNMASLVRFLVDRYATGPRAALRGRVKAALPADYPDVGLYHPRLKGRITDRAEALPSPQGGGTGGTVGLLVMRSYLLAGNTGHYDGVIAALESRGMKVVPAFATGLDARPAIERFFLKDGRPTVDAVVSLTGFSLVGGPAYNDARAAEEMLAKLDVPYVSALAVEFQTLEQWQGSERGLMPVESTIMVAIPELDGSTGSMVFGGRSAEADGASRDMHAHPERADMLAARVERLIALRRTPREERRVGIVLFNFPPNAGNTGTAAYLSVFASLHRTLAGLRDAGYEVEVPETVDELRERIVDGNARRLGAHANVHARIPVDDHVRRERWLADIERHWGPAPGRQQTDGSSLFVLGERFGNVFVGVQPSFGWEGDPMRLLFDRDFAPTHAFSAFYRWMREDFGAHAVLHFGTHGALEFMPGKQAGLSGACWPDRLIGDLPNIYLYASNNPSEGTIAKRRAAATLVSYMTPPIASAGLYKGLNDLKDSINHWRGLEAEARRAARHRRPDPVAGRRARAGARRTRVDRRRRDPHRGSRDQPGRTRADFDSLRPPRRGRASLRGGTRRPADGGCRVLARREAGAGLGRGPRRRRAGRAGDGHRGQRLRPVEGSPRGAVDDQPPALGRPRASRPAARPRRPLHAARPWRRPAAQPAGAADRAEPARLRPVPPAEQFRDQGRRAAGGPAAGAPLRRRQRVARVGGAGAVGHRQPQDRGCAHRPGAGPHGHAAALRRLRPTVRSVADTARRARPPAHRRGDDPLGHLPRPPAAADPHARRGRLPGGHGGRADRAQLRTQARARLPGGAGL